MAGEKNPCVSSSCFLFLQSSSSQSISPFNAFPLLNLHLLLLPLPLSSSYIMYLLSLLPSPSIFQPFPSLSAPLPLFFPDPRPPHCHKSDKIRDCISPLSSPSLKRVSCLRRGVPDIARQTFVTFQWASYFSPPHLVRHQPIIDRLWIREVEGRTQSFQQIAAICVCCYLQYGALWDKRLGRQ